MTIAARAIPVAAGLVADRLLGEPPAAWHPVAGFGRSMEGLERAMYRDGRVAGCVYAAAGVASAALAGTALAGNRASRRASMSLALGTYVAVAGRALAEAANAVAAPLSAGDVTTARQQLPALVGRDTSGLDEGEIARAVVESVAENTVDAVIAPAAWGLLAGSAGVLAYRAVNTLDAMVGHRSSRYEHFGWAAARGDDLAGWLPARLLAVLVGVVRPRCAARVWQAVRRQATLHPSPNAGVAEAAFAAALGIRLGGINVYDGRFERRPTLGFGPPPSVEDVERAIRLSRDVTIAAVVVASSIAALARREAAA